MRTICIIACLCSPIGVYAQGLTPEELRAKIDAQTAQTDPFQSMLNDPDPARSLAAVQLMLETGEPRLIDMAIDFGLQSAVPEVKRAAVSAFLQRQPTLQMQLTVPVESVEDFEDYFRAATNGSILPDGTAIYAVNVGPFNADQNCFVNAKEINRCAVEVGPTGLTVRPAESSFNQAISNLIFTPEGDLIGSTSVDKFTGGIPTTLVILE